MLRPAIELPAETRARAARARLKPFPAYTNVLVRRGDAWYFFTAGKVRRRAAEAKPRETLTKVLRLARARAVPVHQIRAGIDLAAVKTRAVLLDGGRLLGLLESRSASSRPAAGVRALLWKPPADMPVPSVAGRPLRRTKGGDGRIPPRPFTAYPRLDAPPRVAPGEAFELVVGLASSAVEGTVGGPFTVPTDARQFDLVVQVIADGFAAPGGIRHVLHVDRDAPEKAEVRVKLAAGRTVRALNIEVEFSFEGSLCGRAWRAIEVARGATAAAPGTVAAGSTAVSTPDPAGAADLTVSIALGATDSKLAWLFTTRHPVTLPDHEVVTTLRNHSAQTFAMEEIQAITVKRTTSFQAARLLGAGRGIARAMPVEFWSVLGQVWKHVRETEVRVPSLLLVSAEPYVPWELASVEDQIDPALLDAGRPLYLGAQVRMGRWLPAGPKTPLGIQRPVVPPQSRMRVQRMAVVVGDYLAEKGQRPLPRAAEEGQLLADRYKGVRLSATEEDLLRLMRNELDQDGARVAVDAIHFACHGELSLTDHRYNGIVLNDNSDRLDAGMVSGSDVVRARQPFVFLNACQLGQAWEALGDYGGMAGAFLTEGSRGFVAPLWAVDDALANEVAREFYEKALDGSGQVAEVMRNIRARYDSKAEKPQSTFLAYIYYGHPNLVLEKA